jgi:ABC-2 type transport system ATP-binding protein
MSETVLEVKNLVKNYGSFRAVDGISFSVPKGKVVGFLGPNGAGKTTTIQMLLGITERSGGSIKYFGEDFFKNKQKSLQRINSASAFNTLLGRISVLENLLVFAGLYNVKNGKKKIMDLADSFHATDLLPQLYWDLSSGQKTRVNLMKSLLNDPELILMDEPTASLDPDITDKTLTLIEELKRTRNLSILYTSHNMKEITRVCDEVIFLDHGKIVAEDTPLNLTKKISGADLRLIFEDHKDILEGYLKEEKQIFSFPEENTVIIHTQENLISKIIFGAGKKGIFITDIEVEKPTLEDVFLQIARKEENVF